MCSLIKVIDLYNICDFNSTIKYLRIFKNTQNGITIWASVN